MTSKAPMTDVELAEFQRRRSEMRASLACEGMYLTDEEEALFDSMARDRLSEEQMVARMLDYNRAKNRRANAAE